MAERKVTQRLSEVGRPLLHNTTKSRNCHLRRFHFESAYWRKRWAIVDIQWVSTPSCQLKAECRKREDRGISEQRRKTSAGNEVGVLQVFRLTTCPCQNYQIFYCSDESKWNPLPQLTNSLRPPPPYHLLSLRHMFNQWPHRTRLFIWHCITLGLRYVRVSWGEQLKVEQLQPLKFIHFFTSSTCGGIRKPKGIRKPPGYWIHSCFFFSLYTLRVINLLRMGKPPKNIFHCQFRPFFINHCWVWSKIQACPLAGRLDCQAEFTISNWPNGNTAGSNQAGWRERRQAGLNNYIRWQKKGGKITIFFCEKHSME